MNVKKFILYFILVFGISIFLVSCAVKTIGKPSVTSSPFPTATPLASATTSPLSSPSVTPSPPSSPSPSPTPEECKTDDDCHDDGWYDTDPFQTRWVNTNTGNAIADQCTEKEQKKQEYRDYSCNPNSKCEYSIDTSKGDNGYNWIDIGNTRCEPYGTGCVLPASTSPTPSPTVSASPSSSPTLSSSPTSSPSTSSSPSSSPTPTIEGFCKDCLCLEKNCANIYGKDFEKCGKGPGLKCCSKGNCCNNEHCCKSSEECTFFGFIVGDWYCNPQSCPSSHLPKLCEAENKNVCCPADATCIYRSEKGFDGAECGQTEPCNLADGETECPPEGGYFTGGIKCCEKNEKCERDPIHDYPLCKANYCENGYTLCQGKKDKKNDYSWRKRCCKNGFEVCSWNPNGYPLCMPPIETGKT